MKIIKTIDLWTDQHYNHYECFNDALVDGIGDVIRLQQNKQ